jgi:predicted nucleotidyltransferase
MEIVKSIVRVGNSAGVILPREWLNGKARIELIEKPLDINKEIFELLSDYLPDIIGIALVGSYARGEEYSGSDVDVLVITESINTKIKNGKYEIILISENSLKKELEINILPLLPMLKEAKAITNESIFNKYRDSNFSKQNLSFHFNTSLSAMKLVDSEIKLVKEKNESFVSQSTAYSLILRLRELYIVDCILKNEKWSRKKFLYIVKSVSGSLKSYHIYLSVKESNDNMDKLPIKEAERLYSYIFKEINKQKESWVKIKK